MIDAAGWFCGKSEAQLSFQKLISLCYYTYAWSSVLMEKPLFKQTEFYMGKTGSNDPKLMSAQLPLDTVKLDALITSKEPFRPNQEEKAILEAIWLCYGDLEADKLSVLINLEYPLEELSFGNPSEDFLGNIRAYYTLKWLQYHSGEKIPRRVLMTIGEFSKLEEARI